MRRLLVLAFPLLSVTPASAASVYFGLGDSITFGEESLLYFVSDGDRGYVSRFADTLATRNGGVRPAVINLAIDGETADSFQDATGRTPPVEGRTDVPLALQNANYAGRPGTPQRALFAERAASLKAAGETIDTISLTLGFNELAAISTLPGALDLLPGVLATYRANQRDNLTFITATAPDADLYLLNYFNPFPGDPDGNPALAFFNVAGPQLNAVIRQLAVEFGAFYVDTATPFVGREAELTFIDEQPDGFFRDGPFPGVEPIGNVHPNGTGYDVIAAQLAVAAVPVPAPATLALFGLGLAGLMARRLKR